VSRWADAFSALSGRSASLDTMRHSGAPSTVSRSVNSVTSIPTPSELPISPAADRALATRGEAENKRAAIIEHDGKIPREWAEGFARLDPDGRRVADL
jgi:hypothetical protein